MLRKPGAHPGKRTDFLRERARFQSTQQYFGPHPYSFLIISLAELERWGSGGSRRQKARKVNYSSGNRNSASKVRLSVN